MHTPTYRNFWEMGAALGLTFGVTCSFLACSGANAGGSSTGGQGSQTGGAGTSASGGNASSGAGGTAGDRSSGGTPSQAGRGNGGQTSIAGARSGNAGSAGASNGGRGNGRGGSAGASNAGNAGEIWRPSSELPIHWHWQLTGTFAAPRDVIPKVTVYDIDGELSSPQTVAALHALSPNTKVICYFDAGVYEDYRSDKERFPKSIIGKPDVGWPGSYWLDIRQLDILMPILKDRMINWCKNKGFDAIEPDETEVWSNDSGFPITEQENAAFHRALSETAHALGLSIGLKGNNSEAAKLEPWFDWALTEQCWEFDECELFQQSFVKANKAVFNAEYGANPNCALANKWHLNSARRDLDLVGPTHKDYLHQPCVPADRDTWD